MEENLEPTASQSPEEATLLERIKLLESRLFNCPLTHLPNDVAFRDSILTEIRTDRHSLELLLISLDHTNEIRSEYGAKAGDELIIAAASLLRGVVPERSNLFKMGDHEFAYYYRESDDSDMSSLAESIRSSFMNSTIFVKPITVSVGGLKLAEIAEDDLETNEILSKVLGELHGRVKHSKMTGMNRSTLTSIAMESSREVPIVLAVDDDPLQLELIRQSLSTLKIEIITALDGDDALTKVRDQKPSLVICEMAVPKRDGLSLRRELLEDPDLRDIPFLLMTQQKNPTLIKQAVDLGVIHILEKPLFSLELSALTSNTIQTNK